MTPLPGYDSGDGTISFGGWIWRYDLVPLGRSETEVRHSYDWSAVPEEVRRRQAKWPPFSPDHLDNFVDAPRRTCSCLSLTTPCPHAKGDRRQGRPFQISSSGIRAEND